MKKILQKIVTWLHGIILGQNTGMKQKLSGCAQFISTLHEIGNCCQEFTAFLWPIHLLA